MFEDAIKKVSNFTRSINTIQRNYKSKEIIPFSTTLFFVNDEGCAITTRSTLETLLAGEKIYMNYRAFLEECKNVHDDYRHDMEIEELEEKYHLKEGLICDLKNSFVSCVGNFKGFNWHRHPKYDLAIIEFKEFDKALYDGHAVFTRQAGPMPSGKDLCRIGFPFPEFDNYSYDESTQSLEWNTKGRNFTPMFPQVGMVTRNVNSEEGIIGFELNNVSYNGMMGGPVFDEDGVIYGMAYQNVVVPNAVNPIPFNYNVNGKNMQSASSPYVILTRCINADIIKAFLKEHNIKYFEEGKRSSN